MSSSETIESDYKLDTRNLSCPMPLLKTKNELNKMKSGEILEIWGTDEGSKKEISEFAEKKGHEFLGFKDIDEGITKYYIRKG